MEIVSIGEIERMHKGHWFTPGAIRFFKSRLPEVGYQVGQNIYFITSEKGPSQDSRRFYSIRIMNALDGSINTHGNFQGYETLRQAKNALASLLGVGVKEL